MLLWTLQNAVCGFSMVLSASLRCDEKLVQNAKSRLHLMRFLISVGNNLRCVVIYFKSSLLYLLSFICIDEFAATRKITTCKYMNSKNVSGLDVMSYVHVLSSLACFITTVAYTNSWSAYCLSYCTPPTEFCCFLKWISVWRIRVFHCLMLSC